MTKDKSIDNELIDNLLKNYKKPEDLVGENGLLKQLIKLAPEQAKGRVTHAARILGLSYPALSYMLRTRHKDLLQHRTPVQRHPRKDQK